ncbi:stalk domain-containing protein [Cohnella abietis]|uniref:Copper amine oxidase-like N-terminal domain-containing protein n=1 Tax=Cohnella abietis TaxID=2507935 RepID=A0A3T1D116_9BACL|nr:stalk domain-containing protein [Cohnella abietis]BBI31751.1 hypothetical protein KCTCHS21_11500 [Cohnella abietis]
MQLNLRKPLTVILSAIMVLTTIASLASAAPKETETKDVYRIVALGDSVSVGYEPGMKTGSIPYGYVDRLYEQALFHGRSELASYAVMGLTAPGLSTLLKGAADAKKLTSADLLGETTLPAEVLQQADSIGAKTPELAADLAQANLVVLTIGGNDFSPIIKAIKDLTGDTAKQTIENNFNITMNNYAESMDKVIKGLHLLAPNAQIVLADQYLPLWEPLPYYSELSNAVITLANRLDTLAEDLNKQDIPLKIAHVSPKFVKNEKKFTHFNVVEEFDTHPSQAGYESIAQTFAEVIWKQYLKPAPRASGVPISIIINGKEPPNKPTMINNTTFLALTDVADAVGAEVKWTQKTKTAVFSKNGRVVSITVGAKTITINGVSQPISTPAYFQTVGKNLKTYVPLAVISSGLDYQVVYRKNLLAAFINS